MPCPIKSGEAKELPFWIIWPLFAVLILGMYGAIGFFLYTRTRPPPLSPQKVLIGEYINTGGEEIYGGPYSYGGLPFENKCLIQTGSRQYFYPTNEIPGTIRLEGYGFTIREATPTYIVIQYFDGSE